MVYKVGTPKGPLGSCSPEEAAESSDCFPRHESCSQGPSSGAWVLTETIRVGPREPQGLRSVGVHISEEGQAKSCQSPRGRSAHASWAPHPEAVRPGPFRQLAGHQSQKGSRKKHKTRGLSHSVLLLSSSETGQKSLSLVLFPEARQAWTWLLPGRGRPLSPLTVDGIEKSCIPEPQRVPARQTRWERSQSQAHVVVQWLSHV